MATDQRRLVIQGLCREFSLRDGSVRKAVDDVSLVGTAGELLSVLGPNGAGKTTMVRMIAGLLLPTRGTILVNGHDVVRERRQAAFCCGFSLGGDTGLYPRLTAQQNLSFFGLMYGLRGKALARRATELLETMGLADRADEPVSSFSRGMKQRLHIARALLHGPSVLILDEPSAGLDPHSAAAMRSLVARLSEEGRTILLTTHDMREAEELSDRVILMKDGRIHTESTPSQLRRAAATRLGHTVEVTFADDSVPMRVSECPGLLKEDIGDGTASLRVIDGAAAVEWILSTFPQMTVSVAVTPPTLEEVFLEMAAS